LDKKFLTFSYIFDNFPTEQNLGGGIVRLPTSPATTRHCACVKLRQQSTQGELCIACTACVA